MITRKTILLPKLNNVLSEMGENIRLARLRRKLSLEQVAERAGITRVTLSHIEKGNPSVRMAGYAQVLFVLGFEQDLLKLVKDDELGKKIQDTNLIVRKRATKRK